MADVEFTDGIVKVVWWVVESGFGRSGSGKKDDGTIKVEPWEIHLLPLIDARWCWRQTLFDSFSLLLF